MGGWHPTGEEKDKAKHWYIIRAKHHCKGFGDELILTEPGYPSERNGFCYSTRDMAHLLKEWTGEDKICVKSPEKNAQPVGYLRTYPEYDELYGKRGEAGSNRRHKFRKNRRLS